MEYNDYELVSLAQENNEYAIEILHNKYKDIIKTKAKKVYGYLKNTGIELSDIIQEITFGFEEAISGFNQDDNAIFYTFANLCMDRQLSTYILKQTRDKNKILNEAITLDYEDDNNLYMFLKDETTPEAELFNKENSKNIYNNIKKSLTEQEDSVFEMKLQGFNYKEISEVLDLDIKDIYNTIGRIKTKVSKIINE